MTTKQLIPILIGLLNLGYNTIEKKKHSIEVRGGDVPTREFLVPDSALKLIPNHNNILKMLALDFGLETLDYVYNLLEECKHSKTIIHKPNKLQAKKVKEETFLVTMNGIVKTNPGDWIITGINGEQYPCDPEIFKQLYDIVE